MGAKQQKGKTLPGAGDGSTTGMSAALVITICFLITLLDGLDTMSIAFVAPFLASEWGIAPAAFTPAFIATSVGAVIGYMACGPLAQRFSARAVGAGSVILFGLGTLLTATAHDVATLSAWRLVAAIGLGGALPLAISTAVQVAAPGHKETVAMLVAAGLSAGGVVGGVIGGPLMQAYGWAAIFVLGGVLPLLLLPVFWRVQTRAAPPRQSAGAPNPVAALFGPGLKGKSTLLWAFAFLTFISAYALMFWVPTMLTGFGFEPAQAPLGAAAFSTGGLVASLVMMTVVAKLGIRNVLMATTVLAMACIAIISQVDIPPSLVLPLIAGAGAGLITGCVGQSALAVSFYPAALRTTGVGWAAAIGRIGSIAGPALGGALLSLGWPVRDIIMTAIAPALLALVALIALGWMKGRETATIR